MDDKPISKRQAKIILQRFCNTLSLKPVRVARTVHCCALCDGPIEVGTEFRDGGSGKRAHLPCLRRTVEVISR